MKTCRDCPHIAFDRWPNNRVAARCWCAENGEKMGRVVNVARSAATADDVPTPKWCRMGRNPLSKLR